MGEYFTDEQVAEFLRLYEEKYPGALERKKFTLTHPFGDQGEATARRLREVCLLCEEIDFCQSYAQNLIKTGALNYSPERLEKWAKHNITIDKLAFNETSFRMSTEITRAVVKMLGDFEPEE